MWFSQSYIDWNLWFNPELNFLIESVIESDWVQWSISCDDLISLEDLIPFLNLIYDGVWPQWNIITWWASIGLYSIKTWYENCTSGLHVDWSSRFRYMAGYRISQQYHDYYLKSVIVIVSRQLPPNNSASKKTLVNLILNWMSS